jgi:hypothetical protein
LKRSTKMVLGTASAAALIAIGGTSTAVAGQLITGHDIKDGAVRVADLSAHVNKQMNKGTLPGAVYRVENYVNGGGDATVACADDATKSQKYTAIAGGVEAGHTGANDFAVTASFPGRMDLATASPRRTVWTGGSCSATASTPTT